MDDIFFWYCSFLFLKVRLMPFFFVQYCVLCFFFLKDRFFVLFDFYSFQEETYWAHACQIDIINKLINSPDPSYPPFVGWLPGDGILFIRYAQYPNNSAEPQAEASLWAGAASPFMLRMLRRVTRPRYGGSFKRPRFGVAPSHKGGIGRYQGNQWTNLFIYPSDPSNIDI